MSANCQKYVSAGLGSTLNRGTHGGGGRRHLDDQVLGISAAYTAKAIVIAHLASMNPSAGVLAMSSTEVNLKDVPEGKQVTVSWRGKPLFVRHRTPEEIKEANEVDITKLRDPQEDKYRVQDPKFLIVIGVCTHLGCIPMPYVGDFNGYYCPCHGSHYDTSARIRKGPAPYNLEVPSYVFLTPTTIRVTVCIAFRKMLGSLRSCVTRTTVAVPSLVTPVTSTPFITPPKKYSEAEVTPTLAKSIKLTDGAFLSPKHLCGLTSTSQVRLSHTDLSPPSFDDYRKKSTLNPNVYSADTEDQRKLFSYAQSFVLGVTGGYTAKAIVSKFVYSMSASAGVLAMASVEVDLSDVPEGKSVTMTWRGKPLFVRHRTAEEIDRESKVSMENLRDPETDADRVKDPRYLIVIGVCTHLGCVPVPNVGDYKGYYCPCHGSHYDASGRIRKGPAPLNLEVPPYEFLSDTLVRVG
ncbi:unnamed protein product [Cyprideis torosa]|uniref:Uncharacterized protein n=1 Tax=Cyprideis torosa TaxID=163714 RepID=A0A7R8ZLW8_9CRUS|nr:unnamed protein product [Cyprideis torosa]CAG0894215.1 unnamed protein product [Cyprideis torosa]